MSTAAADLVLPFQVDGVGARGRLVRLGPAIDAILGRHDYPEPVGVLLAEMAAMAGLLADALKYEGVFTLQVKGDGPIRLMVADVTSEGNLRAYAQFDADGLADDTAEVSVPRLVGSGYLAFTVDQGENTERYQGIVELTGHTLADCLHHYFRQSEQLSVAFLTAGGRDAEGHWRSGGLMVQRLPAPTDDPEGAAEDWRRAMVLLSSARAEEIWNPDLPPDRLLYRLFHQEGVRVWPIRPIHDRCRCGRDRVTRVLRQFPRAEFDDLRVDGKVVVTCEFCSAKYEFDDADLDALALAAP